MEEAEVLGEVSDEEIKADGVGIIILNYSEFSNKDMDECCRWVLPWQHINFGQTNYEEEVSNEKQKLQTILYLTP